MRRHRILLINPTIASSRTARFPLAVLNLSAALQDRYDVRIIDGNVDGEFVATSSAMARDDGVDAIGISVMGGPQLRSAIAVSRAIRKAAPGTPIVWGGHFPTICPEEALGSDYVDYAIRGQGEATLRELMDALLDDSGAQARPEAFARITGLSWRREGRVAHNLDRPFSAAGITAALPYHLLRDPGQYLKRTYLGRRTVAYQAALGCRFRCTFCGVAAMFQGRTALPVAARLRDDLHFLKDRFGADALQFYDHNFLVFVAFAS